MNEIIKNFHKLSPEKQKLAKLLLKEEGINVNSNFIFPQGRETNIFPLSFAQQRMWFLEKLQPQSPLYIIPSAVEIQGEFRTDYLMQSINTIVQRHEILRTKFIEKEGTGYQQIIDKFKIESTDIDISHLGGNYKNELSKLIKAEMAIPFNLSELPLFRVKIIHIANNHKVLLIPMHHIISDNWSTGIIIKEILALYKNLSNNEDLNIDPLNIQYADFSSWQREWLAGDELNNQKKYWVEELKDSNSVIEIIPDMKRPALQTYNGTHKLFELNENISSKIKSVCKDEDITLFILFLSAFQLLLSRLSNQNDLNIGVPIAGRNRKEVEELIGFFINTIVIRSKIDYSQDISELLQLNKRKTLAAYANQDIPFEMIVDELNLERDMSNTALFQSMLVLNNAPMPILDIEGAKFKPFEVDTGMTKFNLVLSITQNGEKYDCKLEYNTDLFIEETIDQVIKSFITVLEQFYQGRDRLLKNVEVYENSKFLSNPNLLNYENIAFQDDLLLHLEFEKTAAKYKNKIAVTDGIKSLTYYDLQILSEKVASCLIKNGIKSEQSVGVIVDRKIEYIPIILGIMKSGAAFVPIDINLPAERIKYIISDSNIKSIITSKNINNSVIKNIDIRLDIETIQESDVENILTKKVHSQNIAYIIYTSGSTGQPKGVMVEHSKITNHIKQMIKDFDVSNYDKYLEFAAFNFDASIEQIFIPLLCGAEIYLRGNEYWLPSDFIKLIIDNNITIVNPPTVYWNQFVTEIVSQNIKRLGKLKKVIAGGEEMQADYLTKWHKHFNNKIKLINAYGPTETVITSAIFKTEEKLMVNKILHIPIGKCLGLRSVYIIDENCNLLPNGFPGELCFGGELLARGYLNNSDITADKFIPDSFSDIYGARIYRTGDLVRYSKDGFIEYLGRIDNQVKIRGFRIELGEIEETLIKNENVNNAVVIVQDHGENEKNIIAYIVKKENRVIEEDELIKYCQSKLPVYMVPNRIVFINEIPINSNGKIDRSKLPTQIDNLNTKKDSYVAPRTDLEKTITKIVEDTLKLNDIGIYDSFFELGGHSILAIKVISKIRETYGVEIQLKDLFQKPNVFGLSEAVVAAQANILEDDELESLLNEIDAN